MKWHKIGKIFDAPKHGFYYAKSPQALVFDKYIRVYFSTCEHDADKLLSQVAFVDYSLDFKEILNISDGYVIEKGQLGCYDEHGIFPFNPVLVGDKIYAYLGGWTRRKSVPADSSIGLAISKDGGNTFQRIGNGPVLSSSLYEPNLINDGFVQIFQNTFHMWYIYGMKWLPSAESNGEPSRVYKIAHAISGNGIDWKKDCRTIIPDILNDNECQALPTVIESEGKYHMFFCYRQAIDFRNNRNNSYRIGYAISEDLNSWHRNDNVVGIDVSNISTDWDFQMQCYPNVFRSGNKIYMLYNGNEFGKYGFGLAELEGNF